MTNTPEYKDWAEEQRRILAAARKQTRKCKTNREYYLKRKRNKRPFYRKQCSKCGITKSGTEFHVDKRNKDGLRSECKECRLHNTG